MYKGIFRASNFINFGPKSTWSNDQNNFWILLKYDYSDTVLISVTIILALLIIFSLTKKYLLITKFKLPFFHIYNILNGNTKSFFIKNKLKIDHKYFEIINLVLEDYNKFLNQVYWKKTINFISSENILTLFIWINSVLNIILSLFIINVEYYITSIIIFLLTPILNFIYYIILIKINIKNYVIEDVDYKQKLKEWEVFNSKLDIKCNFLNIYNDKLLTIYNTNKKLFFKDLSNKLIKVKINWKYKNSNQNIFKTLDDFEYFNKIMPLDLLAWNKTGRVIINEF